MWEGSAGRKRLAKDHFTKFHQILEAAGTPAQAEALLGAEALEKATPGTCGERRLEPGLCPPHQDEVRIDPSVSQVPNPDLLPQACRKRVPSAGTTSGRTGAHLGLRAQVRPGPGRVASRGATFPAAATRGQQRTGGENGEGFGDGVGECRRLGERPREG